jgi:hypothetical protein
MLRVERVAALVDIAEVDCVADLDRPVVRLLLTGDQLEQRGLAGAVGADDADDPARWQIEAQVLEQQLVAIGLGQAVRLNNVAAKAFG